MRKILFHILLLSCVAGYSQDSIPNADTLPVRYDERTDMEPITYDEESIKDYKEDADFNYEELADQDSLWQRFMRWLKRGLIDFLEWIFGDGIGDSAVLQFILQMLPYFFIMVCLGFVIWLVIKLNPGSKALETGARGEVFLTEEEEIIKSKDIENLIQKALEDKDYRLAVRYYYLLILRKLTNADLIEYEFDKTNSDYFNEIKEASLNKNFRSITTLYDYIWYGNFEVKAEEYERAQMQFKKIESQIPKVNE